MKSLRWLLFCGLLFVSFISTRLNADILDSWHWRNPSPFADTMRSICFGDGKFVAVGDGGVIHTSPDGQLWDDGQRPVLLTLNRVIFANNRFVAVGNNGAIVSSTNGLDWALEASGVTNNLLAVTFGNGSYVATGTKGCLVVSTNMDAWNSSSIGTSDLNWIAFGNGVFVLPATNQQMKVYVSGDLATWQMVTLPNADEHKNKHYLWQVEFGNGVFAGIARDEVYDNFDFIPRQHFYTTVDGTNWNQGAVEFDFPLPFEHRFLTFMSGSFYHFAAYAGGSPSPISRTVNGSASELTYSPSNASSANYMAFGNGRVVLVADNGRCWTSTDVTNWISCHSGFRTEAFQIIASMNKYVVLASSQPILYSADGLNFAVANNSPTAVVNGPLTTGLLNAVEFDGANLVAVGGYSSFFPSMVTVGLVYTSTNGIDWVSRNGNANQPLTAVCRGSTRWVAVGQSGTVISSPNTLAWTLRTSGTVNTLKSVAFGNDTYVAVGNGGTVISSPDGATWDVQYAGTISNLNCVRFINGQFFAAGDGGIILSSSDGGSWSNIDSGTTKSFASIAFGDGRYVICGANVVLASTNGLNWQDITTKVPWATSARSIAFLNQSFWITGGGGAILQSDSTDGLPRLKGDLMAENSGFQLKILQNIPATYRIQCSTNLAANSWQDVATNGAPSFVWTDTNILGSSMRLYRVVAP